MPDVFLSPKAPHQPDVPTDLSELLSRILMDLDAIKRTLSKSHKSHYTVDEIANLVGRSAYTVRRWIAEKRILATRVQGTGPKGKLLVSRDQLEILIEFGKGDGIPDAVTPQQ